MVVNGLEWSARSADSSIIEVDTMVTVKAIEGVKVIVERCVLDESAESKDNI